MPTIGSPYTAVQSVNGKGGPTPVLTSADVGAPFSSYWRGTEVPVIGLHGDDPTVVVKTCLRRGFTPIWASELADALKGKRGLPAQPVMLTFDDGYPVWLTVNHPILSSYNFKATLAVTSEFLYGRTTADLTPPGLTWAQARTLNASGLYDWANHTATHAVGPTTAEMSACQQAIQTELGVTARSIVYPHGSYDAATLDRARTFGFELGFTYSDNDHPSVLPGAGPLNIARSQSNSDPLRWARQTVIHDPEHDMTGGRNDNNQLGYWTFDTGAGLNSAGYAVRLDSITPTGVITATTTDFFHVASGILYSHCLLASTSQTAGTGKINVLQYDVNQAPLSTLTLATVSAVQGQTASDADVNLDPACRFIRLQIITDAAYDGQFDVFRWVVRIR